MEQQDSYFQQFYIDPSYRTYRKPVEHGFDYQETRRPSRNRSNVRVCNFDEILENDNRMLDGGGDGSSLELFLDEINNRQYGQTSQFGQGEYQKIRSLYQGKIVNNRQLGRIKNVSQNRNRNVSQTRDEKDDDAKQNRNENTQQKYQKFCVRNRLKIVQNDDYDIPNEQKFKKKEQILAVQQKYIMKSRDGQLDCILQLKDEKREEQEGRMDIQKMIDKIDQNEIGGKKYKLIELDYEFSFDSKQKDRGEKEEMCELGRQRCRSFSGLDGDRENRFGLYQKYKQKRQ